MAHTKPVLPEKECATCGRPFTWRKKWARNWEEMKYCSKRCATNRKRGASNNPPTTGPSSMS